MSGNYRW